MKDLYRGSEYFYYRGGVYLYGDDGWSFYRPSSSGGMAPAVNLSYDAMHETLYHLDIRGNLRDMDGNIIATKSSVNNYRGKKGYGHWEKLTIENNGRIHGKKLNNPEDLNNIDEIIVAEKWIWDVPVEREPLIKFVGFNHGIPEFESRLMPSGTAVTPGPIIIYSTGASSDPYYNTHEPGHVVQFYLLGRPINYYRFIAIPSLISVMFFPNQHNDMPWETSANQLWFWLTGERYEDNPLFFKRIK